jgi:hypothetical protein
MNERLSLLFRIATAALEQAAVKLGEREVPRTGELKMKRISIVALALLTSACATTYGELGGWTNDGVAAEQLTADTFRIRSRGNSNTEDAAVQDFAMLRAAETMRSNCLTHFVVLEGVDRTEVEENVTPEQVTTTIKEKVVDGKKEKVVERSYTPSVSWTSVRPGADFYVRGLRVAPGERAPLEAISADEVLRFVGPRVVRRKNAPPPVFPECSAWAERGGL